MYFSKLPGIKYGYSPQSVKSSVNILQSAKFSNFFKQNAEQLFVEYIVKDGEKPEDLAYKVYGAADLHWIILLFNDIKNPYFDWPLNSSILEEQIIKTYPGSAIFVPVSPNFYKTDGTKMLAENSQFVVGNTVSHENNYWTATITGWNSTLRKLEIDNIVGTFDSNISNTYTGNITSKNKNNETFKVAMKRVVFDNTFSLHHFENDDGTWIDPYENVTETGESTYILKRYIENSSDLNVIVNRRYEEVVNDNKRKILLLKVDYLSYVVDTYTKLFNG